MEVLPTFTLGIQISTPTEVEMADHRFRRDNSAIEMVKRVVGADKSRRASRLRRQRLKPTARLAASTGFPAASIGKTGEYIRPSATVAAYLGAKAIAGDENCKKSTETSPLNGGKHGWNHARGGSYSSLRTIFEGSVTIPLLGASSYDCSTTMIVFDIEHSTSRQRAKAAVYRWNKWIKLHISFLPVIFLTFGLLIAIRKVVGAHRKGAVDGGDISTKSSAGTSTEASSFWYTLAVAMAVGFADLIFGGGLVEL